MKEDEKVSILMPCKNAAPFLPACLESIINQKYENWELLVVDDHSRDNSPKILNRFAKNEKRIKVLKNAGRGIIPALQTAFSRSSGPFISRMDADDIMKPDKLSLLLEALQNKGPGTVATGLVEYFSENQLQNGFIKYARWLNRLTEEECNFDDIYRECVIPSPSWMLYREDYIKLHKGEPLHYPEDYNLVFRMYLHDFEVSGVREVIHLWRDHPLRASRLDPRYSNQLFHKMKIPFFLQKDYREEKHLVLWGSGTKGKKIAIELNERGIPFSWITNNKNKIGKNIYGIKMRSDENNAVFDNAQVLIAVSAPSDVAMIEKKLLMRGMSRRKDYFWFC